MNYFFAHDQINYARLSPVYLATMSQLQESDPDTCCYLQENFAIAKSDILFTAIWSDHAMEQENIVLKVNIFSFIGNLSEVFEGANYRNVYRLRL